MAEIDLRDIEKYFGDNYVIRKLNLTIAHKEFVVLLGPSGCGKTTTLRAIAGLEDIDTGDILIDGKPVQDLQRRRPRHRLRLPALRALSASHRLREHRLPAARHAREPRRRRCQGPRRSAKALQIEHLLNRRPSALSGGDMQRVAIGRALVRRPKAMLMDEPIGALDAKLREEMRTELKRLHLENEQTTVYVTHDQVEAMSLADRIAIMNEGVLQQVGTPTDVYQHPANLFVAQFVGSPVMNIAHGAPGGERRSRQIGARRRRRLVRLPAGAAAAHRSAPARRPSSRSASARKACWSRASRRRATFRSRRTSSSRSAPTTSST